MALPARMNGRPWLRAALWLAGLGVLFYSSYGFANYLAGQRTFVPSIVFGWEQGMPFLPWTIIPYWSINLFYAASLFVCTTKAEVDALGRRLLTAQIIAVSCFIFLPLRFTFAKPEIGGGVPGFMFDALLSFDKPYNQAPSLHIALLVILWVHYARYIPRWAHWPLHLWFVLIGVSVLTTYQHHFFDVPTGALLGLFCLWLWPDEAAMAARDDHATADVHPGRKSALADLTPAQRSKRLKLTGFYGAGAVLLAGLGIAIGGWGLWLCYPAVSLALVAANYAWCGAAGFQKRPDGTMPIAPRLLFAPYQLGAFINSRWWTRRAPEPAQILPGLFVGRIPSRFDRHAAGFSEIIDLVAELPARRGVGTVRAVPMLDLVTAKPTVLADAAKAIDAARGHGTVLVCCALGYSRSAAAVAVWLLASGHAKTVDEAIGIVRKARPRIVLGPEAHSAIAAAGKVEEVDG